MRVRLRKGATTQPIALEVAVLAGLYMLLHTTNTCDLYTRCWGGLLLPVADVSAGAPSGVTII